MFNDEYLTAMGLNEMKFFTKLVACTLAGLLTTGVAVADDNRDTSGAGMTQGDRQEMMKNMSDEERQAMRNMQDEQREMMKSMSDKERQAMRKMQDERREMMMKASSRLAARKKIQAKVTKEKTVTCLTIRGIFCR